MTLLLKAGGAWQTVGDGHLRVKAGGAWQSPARCYIKANNGWQDTGYRGYPNPPTGLRVHSWGYGHLQVAWDYVGSGPAISYYDVQLLDVNGNPTGNAESSVDNVGPVWGVNQDTRYQVRVRSVGQNGLVGDWQPYLRVGIGHPETQNWGYVERTREWWQQIGGPWGRDTAVQIYVPSRVWITEAHYSLSTPQSSVLSATGSRWISSIISGVLYGDKKNWPSPYYAIDSGFWMSGGDTYWGFFILGSGWGVNDSYYMVNGTYGIKGVEYYDNLEVVSTNPAQANYWW